MARRTGNHVLVKQRLVDWRSLVNEFNSEQKPETTYANYLWHCRKLLAQISFDRLHVRQHPIVLNGLKRCRHRSHGNHAATESRAEIVLLDVRSNILRYQACPHRNSTTERFGQGDDVRHNASPCFASGKKPFASATDPGLDLVVDQNDSALVAQFVESTIELGPGHAHTGHRLNRHKHD